MDLARPGAPSGDRARVARLTRHLKARLEDFGPGGPQVTGVDEASGTVTARFPGQDTLPHLTGRSFGDIVRLSNEH